MTTQKLIEQLDADGGAIVSSGECSEIEIAEARVTGRFAVNEEGYGYVRRYKEWLALHKTCGATLPATPENRMTLSYPSQPLSEWH